jgi:hypothetical protein
MVRSEYRSVPLISLLQQPCSALLGVNDTAKASLNDLSIVTIFDLASSTVFDSASKIVAASTDPHNAVYRFGQAPADLVRASVATGIPLTKLLDEPITLLAVIPRADAHGISQALDAATVRDLAMYPPYHSARKIMKAIYSPQEKANFDPEYPPDLVPTTGEYPIEKVQYSTLHMGQIPMSDERELTDMTSSNFRPPSLDALAAAQSAGFKKVATGALLTFSQSWFAQGVTLGHLLHSCTLSPGRAPELRSLIGVGRKEETRLRESRSRTTL